MLKTPEFEFDRKGHLTLFVERIELSRLIEILKMCVMHSRRKHTCKPRKYAMVPTLTA